jgi:hypothetical protein
MHCDCILVQLEVSKVKMAFRISLMNAIINKLHITASLVKNMPWTTILGCPEKSAGYPRGKNTAGQQLWDKQIYKSHWWVTASQRNMFPWNRLNYNEERCFLCGPCWDVISGTSWELQLVSQWKKSRRLMWDGCQHESYSVGAMS